MCDLIEDIGDRIKVSRFTVNNEIFFLVPLEGEYKYLSVVVNRCDEFNYDSDLGDVPRCSRFPITVTLSKLRGVDHDNSLVITRYVDRQYYKWLVSDNESVVCSALNHLIVQLSQALRSFTPAVTELEITKNVNNGAIATRDGLVRSFVRDDILQTTYDLAHGCPMHNQVWGTTVISKARKLPNCDYEIETPLQIKVGDNWSQKQIFEKVVEVLNDDLKNDKLQFKLFPYDECDKPAVLMVTTDDHTWSIHWELSIADDKRIVLKETGIRTDKDPLQYNDAKELSRNDETTIFDLDQIGLIARRIRESAHWTHQADQIMCDGEQ